mgnify:CR=1 FL=1|jgi:hypothetical protein
MNDSFDIFEVDGYLAHNETESISKDTRATFLDMIDQNETDSKLSISNLPNTMRKKSLSNFNLSSLQP